jgi:superfamily II DNA or RNA helicase
MNTMGLSTKEIGQIGGGRRRQVGLIDLAMIQSLSNRTDIEQIFDKYGLVVVDECHHIPAVSFERVINRAPIRHIIGLTATPYRRDGLQDIITMQCGPIRHKISSQQAGKDHDLDLQLTVRETSFEYPDGEDVQIQDVFRELIRDSERTSNICADGLEALREGRRILMLSEWREHCRLLAEELAHMGKTCFVLDSTLKKKVRDEMFASIRRMPPEKDLLIIATGNYIGEGFDCPQIDTLFLTFPVSFRGRIVQYVGRLMRQWEGKADVRVYDYADIKVSVLKRMHNRRLKAYLDLGFATNAAESNVFLE